MKTLIIAILLFISVNAYGNVVFVKDRDPDDFFRTSNYNMLCSAKLNKTMDEDPLIGVVGNFIIDTGKVSEYFHYCVTLLDNDRKAKVKRDASKPKQ